MMVAFREGNISTPARLQDSRLAPQKEPTRVISAAKAGTPGRGSRRGFRLAFCPGVP